jgi:hypothetical protein
MSGISVGTLRRLQRRFEVDLGDLITWQNFSIEDIRRAVAARVNGEIVLQPLHWEMHGYFGLTLGCLAPQGKQWLVLYEQDADAEHRLVIVLHELMHIALGHCSTTLTPEELRSLLVALNLIPDPSQSIVYMRVCVPGAVPVGPNSDAEEIEAELAATWLVTRAKRADILPPAGQTFSPELSTISMFLGAETSG